MYGDKFKQATESLMHHCREQLGYDHDPDIHYVTDDSNANKMLGLTAHYQPEKKVVTIYISNRHPKDALRSLAHELVHHAQNCRGDLQNVPTEEGYAQSDPHMRTMEEEAYLKGNMMFRDWEDACKAQGSLNLNLPTTLGEQKMNNLKDLIKKKIMETLISEISEAKKPDEDGDGVPDWADKKPGKDDHAEKEDKPKKKSAKGEIPPQLRDHVKGKQNKKDEEDEEKVNEENVESELVDIKQNQSSIEKLNENRLLNINKALMKRLLK